MRTLKKLIGYLLAIPSSGVVAAAGHELLFGDRETPAGALLTLLVVFGGTAFAGVQLVRSARKTKPPELRRPDELLVLQAAKAAGGTIGAAQLATDAGISFAEAKAALERLSHQGACQVLVDEQGCELFRFPDLALAPGEAARAKDLLQ